MDILSSPKEVAEWVRGKRLAGETIGFVPTMGYLHEGHLSLVETARSQNTIVIVSIFVNPLQFGPTEDFAVYPRDMQRDTELLHNARVDLLFAPQVEDMYTGGRSTVVSVPDLQDSLCGKARPGHFDGVTTVVSKLFNIVMPDKAYFGLKDYQQYLIIKKMAADLNMPVDICGCPIVREKDGLAMSSRNKYLSPKQRAQAPFIYAMLKLLSEKIKEGASDYEGLKKYFTLEVNSRIDESRLDYIEVLDGDTLDPISRSTSTILLATAVFVGTTRLIDNVVVPLANNNHQN